MLNEYLNLLNIDPRVRFSYEIDIDSPITGNIRRRYEAMKKDPCGTPIESISTLAWYRVELPTMIDSHTVHFQPDARIYLIRKADGSLWIWKPDLRQKYKVFRIDIPGKPVKHTYYVLERKEVSNE